MLFLKSDFCLVCAVNSHYLFFFFFAVVAEIQNEHIHFQIYSLCTKTKTNLNFESAQSVVTVRHIPFKRVMFALAAIVCDMTFFKARQLCFYFF